MSAGQMHPGFILNVNASGPDVIHDIDSLTERCNTDDSLDKQTLDFETGKRLAESADGIAVAKCQHCLKELRG